MYPRMPEDLDVSPKELIKALKAKNGFDELIYRYLDFDVT